MNKKTSYKTPLDRIMTENKIRNIDLWKVVNKMQKVDYSYICKIRRGVKIPGRLLAPIIENALFGKVSRSEIMYPDEYM